jgi:hypothetical protein
MRRVATYSRGKGSQTPARVRCMSMPPSVAVPLCLRVWGMRGACACGSTHVYLAILEALFQIVVDGLVRNLADQGEIRDSDFLLLGGLKDGLLCELRLWLSSSTSRSILFAPGALCYCLNSTPVSAIRGVMGVCILGPRTMADAQLRAQMVARVSQSMGCRVCRWTSVCRQLEI